MIAHCIGPPDFGADAHGRCGPHVGGPCDFDGSFMRAAAACSDPLIFGSVY
jgi:hypothetical protein